jgi:DNA-directed RNA polymerase specialized sigma24 family protein
MTTPPDPANASDQELVTMALEGHEEAKTELANRYRQPVQTAISHLVGNDEDVQDLTQDTFAKVFEELATVRDESKVSAWIFRIANNVALNHLKHEGLVESMRVDTVPLDGASQPSAPRHVNSDGAPLAASDPAFQLVLGVAITTAGWLTVTFLTRPTDRATLRAFYDKIKPISLG